MTAKKAVIEGIKQRNLSRVYDEVELPLIPVLDAMKERGIKIDREYLAELSKEYNGKIKELEKGIYKLAGQEFNINSPKQLGEILFDKLGLRRQTMKKTAGGARSTKESELLKLSEHAIVKKILDYRQLAKLVGTYIDAIPPLLDKNDRLHATFDQTGAVTGRMSSNNPNLQNIPIQTEEGRRIRDAFIAEKGFSLVSLDYSQIELRIAAFLANDEEFMKIFQERPRRAPRSRFESFRCKGRRSHARHAPQGKSHQFRRHVRHGRQCTRARISAARVPKRRNSTIIIFRRSAVWRVISIRSKQRQKEKGTRRRSLVAAAISAILLRPFHSSAPLPSAWPSMRLSKAPRLTSSNSPWSRFLNI